MIITDRFVFLHLHKSGGTFVNEGLMRHLPDARHVGYHLPRTMIPPEAQHLPVVGTVRNPWSYYVSWYSFQREHIKPNYLFRILSDGGRLDFDATLRNMLDLGSGSIRLDLLARALPARYGNQGLNLPGFALLPIRNTGLGFYTFLYRYMYGGAGQPIHLISMEDLRAELVPLLERLGHPLTDGFREFVAHEAPRNVSSHLSFAHYYSDSLRQLVRERDAEVIERHQYSFGDDA